MRMISLFFRIATLGTYYRFIVRRSIRAVWFFVATNADLAVTEDSGLQDRLRAETRGALMRNGYPRSSVSEVAVGLVSSENVEKGGGWRYFR
jgi:hypothetical protein